MPLSANLACCSKDCDHGSQDPCAVVRSSAFLAVPPPGVSDLLWNTESLGNDGSAFSDTDWLTFCVSQLVGVAGAQHLADPINEACRDGAQSLLVMMALAYHQSPIDLSQTRIDATCRISGKIECTLDTIVAGLGNALSGLVGAARRIDAGKQSAEPSQLMQSGKPARLVQHTEHKRCQGFTDSRDGPQGIGWVQLVIEYRNLSAEFADLGFQQTKAVDLESYLKLQIREVDRRPV